MSAAKDPKAEPEHSHRDTEASVATAQTEALYRRSAVWPIINLAAAVLLAYALRGEVEDDALLLWLTTVSIVSLSQLLLSWLFSRSPLWDEYHLQWRIASIAGWLIAGSCWGAAAFLLFPGQSVSHQAMMGLIVTGLATGLVWPLSPLFPAAIGFLASSIGPLAFNVISQSSSAPQEKLGHVLLAILLIMIIVAIRISRSTAQALQLKLETQFAIREAKALNLTLKEEISERWKVEQELNNAINAAESAAKAKGDFLATMSHEIRTPLNGVLGMLDLLKEMDMDKEQVDLAETAHYSAESLLSIINNVLDFSRIEMGELELENIEFNLPRTLKDVATLMQRRAEEKGIYVEMARRTAGTPATVMGDPTRLRQILTNLVGNAVKFTRQGGVDVSVTLMRRTHSKVVLRFEVRDTGIGINELGLQKLFQPFAQADSSMARKYGGSGLGLSIAKHLVTLMGGQIGVESRPNEGSLFWFTAPFSLPGQADEPLRKSIAGTRLLLVGGDGIEKQNMTASLQEWKVNLETATSLNEALGKIAKLASIGKSWLYEAIVLCADIGSNAQEELTRSLNQDKAIAGIAVIALTSSRDQQHDLPASGLMTRLSLPITSEELFRAIAENTAERGSSAHAAFKHDSVEPLVPDRPPVEKATDTAKSPASSVSFQNQKMLVVEDNLVNQKVVKTLLTKMGLEVDTANDGFEGVDALQKGRYAAVLMDCQMPGLDGFDATREIRNWEQQHERARTPVIAVTANAMEGDRERCLESGMDDYLAKPIKRAELARLLEKWIRVETHETGDTLMPEQNAADDHSPVNQDVLDELKEIMEEDFADLVRTYLDDAPQRLREVRDAIRDKDVDALRASAHTLKSSSANLGALHLSALAKELELLARGGSTRGGSSLFNQALEELKRVKKVLQPMC